MEGNLLGDWLGYAAAIVALLFGGGGIAAYFKQRQDTKRGVHQETRADVDSLNARAIAIVESQFTYLVKPLQDKVGLLETNVKSLETELKTHRALYQSAVTHIRTLYTWIARHWPTDLPESTEIPRPPADLAADVQL